MFRDDIDNTDLCVVIIFKIEKQPLSKKPIGIQIKPRTTIHLEDSLHSLDSANACGALGRRFESDRVRFIFSF